MACEGRKTKRERASAVFEQIAALNNRFARLYEKRVITWRRALPCREKEKDKPDRETPSG
jgi:hypothetical protein